MVGSELIGCSFRGVAVMPSVAVRDQDVVGGGGGVGVEQQGQARAEGGADDWKTMNIGTEAGAMPAKVSVNMRAMVTAGLAKWWRR